MIIIGIIDALYFITCHLIIIHFCSAILACSPCLLMRRVVRSLATSTATATASSEVHLLSEVRLWSSPELRGLLEDRLLPSPALCHLLRCRRRSGKLCS